jgi:cysteine desulfurase/selenocysteine lyase
VTPDGRLDVDELERLISPRTRLLALTHQSNVTGAISPLAEIVKLAHAVGVPVAVDGAQSVPHFPVDVRRLGIDFLCFSGHKMLAPYGMGVLFGRGERLAAMPPFLTGGSMMEVVTMEQSSFLPPLYRFEPGVPPAAQAVGLAAACDYLGVLGMDRIAAHEQALTGYALETVGAIPGVRILGPRTREDRAGTVSFVVDGITRTTWASTSTGSASRCAPGATAPGRCTAPSARRRARGPRSTSTTRSRRSTRSATASGRRRSSSAAKAGLPAGAAGEPTARCRPARRPCRVR